MKFRVYIYYFFIFLLLYVFALNFNFIEGDDATTLMYHYLGRNPEIQPPYSAYHGMFDTVLSVIDSDIEKLLRVTSILSSFIFGFAVLLLLTSLVVLKNGKTKSSYWVLLLLPFLMPEILFSGLIVNPTQIAMTFLLLAHIFLIKYLRDNKLSYAIISIVLFGFGVSFRWSCGFYLFVFFAEYLLNGASSLKNATKQIFTKQSFLLFFLYVFSVVGFIALSGYSFTDVLETFNSGNSYMKNKDFSLLSYGSTALAFITPSVILLFFTGVLFDVKKRNFNNLLILGIGLFPYICIGIVPSYKYMITILVPLVLIIISGFKSFKTHYQKTALILVVFLPWIIGVEVKTNSSWGPGFEVQQREFDNGIDEKTSFNPDKSLQFNSINPTLGSGMAMPTLEGPRPLFGYFYCFFNDWYQFLKKHNDDRFLAVNFAKEHNIDIVQDVKHSFIASKLIELNHHTNQPFNNRVEAYLIRDFVSGTDTITIKVLPKKQDIFNYNKLTKVLEDDEIVVYSSYSNIITKLKAKYKNRFIQKSAFWGVLEKTD